MTCMDCGIPSGEYRRCKPCYQRLVERGRATQKGTSWTVCNTCGRFGHTSKRCRERRS
jgi:hypothetical protein